MITKLNPDIIVDESLNPSKILGLKKILHFSDEIWYTSSDGNIVKPYSSTVFGANIVSNTYTNGQGKILFDAPIISIGERAFYNCTGLTSITIPNSVTEIGNNAFSSCKSLTSITIPNSVTSIGKEAFVSCSSLTSITIPNSVTSIGRSAFWTCTSLKSITIPNSVTSIGQSEFYRCTSLKSVTIDNSVTSIGNEAFSYCTSLKSVTIPDSVTSIGVSAFSGCNALKHVIVRSSIPPTMSSTLPNTVECVYVPSNVLEDYKNATNWSNQNLLGSDVLNNSGDDILLTLLTLEKRINELENN